jgi:hypothetical protein
MNKKSAQQDAGLLSADWVTLPSHVAYGEGEKQSEPKIYQCHSASRSATVARLRRNGATLGVP